MQPDSHICNLACQNFGKFVKCETTDRHSKVSAITILD